MPGLSSSASRAAAAAQSAHEVYFTIGSGICQGVARVLFVKYAEDVWSKRTWEVPGKDAGAAEPTQLTRAQAAAIEAEHLPKRLTPDAESGTMRSRKTIRISMQFFGQPNFSNQTTAGIRKSIRSLRKRISEHLRKIEDADSMYSEWGQLSSREQAGNIKHWRKEIERFKRQIEQAEEELRKRGEKV